jgi:hypothetical protein
MAIRKSPQALPRDVGGIVFTRARHRRAPTPHETGVVLANLHPTAGQCRGALHAGQRRRVTWFHRARWHQGDAPRRPYTPRRTATRIAPAAIAGTPRTRCRGGSRTTHTMPRDVRDANVAMGAYVRAIAFRARRRLQARGLYQRTWQHAGRIRCMGGWRARAVVSAG